MSMNRVTPQEMVEIEKILDRRNLAEVLQALVNICNEKADHVRTNWQDARLAKRWESGARVLDRAMMSDAVQRL